MATASKTKSDSAKSQAVEIKYQETKRLSKAAIWRQNNPNGIGRVIDWRAVNK